MPDGVSERGDAVRSRLLPLAVEVLAVVAAFAVVGAAAGWLWFHAWQQPTGTVRDHLWYPHDEAALRDVFDATGWYVVLAAAGGVLVGGLAAAFGRRAPLVTLVAVAAGSLIAAWLMLKVGLALSPGDPATLAKTAADNTELRGRISLEGGNSPYLAWPLGSLVALMVLNLLLSSRDEIRGREAVDPQWLSRHQPG
jgi:hypothetical protein